jgi:hypothetical protein
MGAPWIERARCRFVAPMGELARTSEVKSPLEKARQMQQGRSAAFELAGAVYGLKLAYLSSLRQSLGMDGWDSGFQHAVLECLLRWFRGSEGLSVAEQRQWE